VLSGRVNSIMGSRIFCSVLFVAVFKSLLGVLCAKHLTNREVKDRVVDNIKAKPFLPSNDHYFS
jgi:hypothetical protein